MDLVLFDNQRPQIQLKVLDMVLCLRTYTVIFECIFSISSYIYKTVLVVVVLMLLNDKGVKNNAMTFLCQEDI